MEKVIILFDDEKELLAKTNAFRKGTKEHSSMFNGKRTLKAQKQGNKESW